MSTAPLELELRTPRLLLRRFTAADADRVHAILSNWNTARMLRMAAWPPDLGGIRDWLAGHEAEWTAGTAFRFAVVLDGKVVGCVDVAGIDGTRGDLGYWLDEAVWGRGLATEAGRAVVAFAFRDLGLEGLVSGHALDNLGSGAVLAKLGFRRTGESEIVFTSRRLPVRQVWYERLA
jgi:RimJ/RimL family protein N-acetyltransferase